MMSGKPQAAARPTALGTMLQAATYGAAIPTIYGVTRSALLVIWAQDLRPGSSDKKIKTKKKGIQTYVENIDFLIGSNPIDGFLSIWNNTTKFPVNYVKLDATLAPSTHSYTIADSNFYFLIAVTQDVTNSGTFNDFGASGPSPYNDTSEYPLWNAFQNGPDLIQTNAERFWPYVYKWSPADGNVVSFPSIQNFFGSLNLHFYYAQKSAVLHHMTPAQRLRLTFEQVLGSGPEYAPSSAPEQQILYPEYAGAGSPDIDMGSAAAIPSIRPEVAGSFRRYGPRGDADFPDMIEDIIKSGMQQVGSQLGLIQRGANLNDLPGAVQKTIYWELEPTPVEEIFYWQPIAKGTVMFAYCAWRGPFSGSNPTIADASGQTWVPIMFGTQGYCGLWYAIANADIPAGDLVTITWAGTGFAFDIRAHIWSMDPGTTLIDKIAEAHGTGGSHAQCTIVVENVPAVIMVAADFFNGFFGPTPIHWQLLFTGIDNTYTSVYYRVVNSPGAYTFKIKTQLGPGWDLGMVVAATDQPVPYPKALGNIIDEPTMNLLRAQVQANSLFGSLTTDSQKAASNWLDDLYKCANGAPVWSGFTLKSIPRSEVSAVGGGRVYISPTSTGPVAHLTERDLVGDPKTPMVTVERSAQVDANNILQVQYFDRNSDYNQSSASEPLTGAIALFGPRKEAPMVLPEIQDPAVARKILAVEVRRRTLVDRIKYKFTAKAEWAALLEAMDLVAIDEKFLGFFNLPVRLTKTVENDNFELECEAEPFVYGASDPTDLPATIPIPYVPGSAQIPANVNTPIIFEPPLRMSASGRPELWTVVSDSDPIYGGVFVYISTDGGVSYKTAPVPAEAPGIIQGNAVQGFVDTADWPAAGDPDAANDLHVDLTESNGALNTITPDEENNFEFPCYVEGVLDPTPTFVGATGNYGGLEPSANLVASFPSGGQWGILAVRARGTGTAVWLVQTVAGAVRTAVVGSAAGTGFAVGDLLKVTGGGGTDATLQVATIGGGGAIASYNVVGGGAGYINTTNAALTVVTGTGSGGPNATIASLDIGGGGTSFEPGCCLDAVFVPEFHTCCTAGCCSAIPGYIIKQVLLPGSPTNFLFDLENVGITIGPDGHDVGIVTSASCLAGNSVDSPPPPSVTLDGVTFDNTGATVTYQTGGGSVCLVELQPKTLGNPPLFVAVCTGCNYTVPPTGWTLVFTGTLIQVLTMIGPHSNPASACNFELMAYLTATLTATSKYTLPAGAGGPLRRGIFGQPTTGGGGLHPIGSKFAWLNSRELATVPGILKIPLDPAWIGVNLFFKFQAYNAFGLGVEDIADCVAYEYMPVGCGSGVGGGGTSGGGSSGGGPGTGSGQTPYTITGGALTQPDATHIDMADAIATFPGNTANYNARVFVIAAVSQPTTFYVTIADPQMLGDIGTNNTTLVGTAQASPALVGVQGNIYIGSIVVVPAPDGVTPPVTGPGGFPTSEQILINGQ